MTESRLTSFLQSEREIPFRERLSLVWELSVPAILAQISEIIMQYIDAAMVGSLGAAASASIGLVASSTWLIGGLMSACAAGFCVQVAHAVGAGQPDKCRQLLREGVIISALFAALLTVIGTLVSTPLPMWLGADASIRGDASSYFRIYALFIPFRMFFWLGQMMLQCTGNMKTPGRLNVLMCCSDILFNFLLIYPSRMITIGSLSFWMPGAGLGVLGAALGTAFAVVAAAVPMMISVFVTSPVLSLRHDRGPWKLVRADLAEAWHLALPMGFEQAALTVAQIVSVRIVAPLGTIAIAANSFAVTAESLCYMPGYGIGSAATTMVGQAVGARRRDAARSFAWLTVGTGMAVMTLSGTAMYFLSPLVLSFLTPDPQVRQLAVQVLRIELLAEPLFAASIVASGALRGAGDTLVPALLNLVSIWGVRLTLASVLAVRIGLRGVWIAMCTELCIRGILFLIRLKREKWLEKIPQKETAC